MYNAKKILVLLLSVALLAAISPVASLSTNAERLRPLSGVQLYGYRVWDDDDSLSYAWISFTDDNPASVTEEHIEENAFDDYSDISAGAYYNGYVFGFAENGGFYRISAADWSRDRLFNDSTGYNGWSDMTYDYTTDTIYAIAYTLPWESSEDSTNISASFLVKIDLYDYSIEEVAQITTGIITLAADARGQLYGVAMDGCLYSINKSTGACTVIGSTGQAVEYAQSMCYDYNTDTMYWALCNVSQGKLCSIDLEDASVTVYGTIGGNTEVVSLFIIPENEATHPVTGIEISVDEAEVSVGASITLCANVLPANASERRVIWSSSDGRVAYVNESGVVCGMSEGTATITAESFEGGFTASCEVTVTPAASTSDYRLVDTVQSDRDYIIVAYCDGVPCALINRNARVSTSSEWGATLVPIVLSQDGQYVTDVFDSTEDFNDIIWRAQGSDGEGYSFQSISNGRYFGALPLCNWTAIVDEPDYWKPVYDITVSSGDTIDVLKSVRAEADEDDPRDYMTTTSIYYSSAIFDFSSLNNAECIYFFEYVGGSEPSYDMGDVNLDGSITANDALLILRHCLGAVSLEADALALADFNGDGQVLTSDALLVMRCSLLNS